MRVCVSIIVFRNGQSDSNSILNEAVLVSLRTYALEKGMALSFLFLQLLVKEEQNVFLSW